MRKKSDEKELHSMNMLRLENCNTLEELYAFQKEHQEQMRKELDEVLTLKEKMKTFGCDVTYCDRAIENYKSALSINSQD